MSVFSDSVRKAKAKKRAEQTPVHVPDYIGPATRPGGTTYAIRPDSSTRRQGTREEYEQYLVDMARTLELVEGGRDDLADVIPSYVDFEDFTVMGIKPYEPFNLAAEIAPVLAVISAFIPPLAPYAQAALALSDGEIGFNDVLALAGVAGVNPLSGITNSINTQLGIDPSSAFAVTDSVVSHVLQGDLQGAALDYANTGMIPDVGGAIELPTGISDALAALDDAVIQPVINAVAPLGDAVGAVGAAVDDAFIQPVVQAGSALNDAVEPLTSLVSDLGDVAQENILDPLVDFGSSIDDTVSDAIPSVYEPVSDALATAEDVVSESIPSVYEPVSDALAAAEDVVSEAIPSTSIDIPSVDLPSLDVSLIAQLFDMPAVSFRDDKTRTTDSLFGDLFKFKTQITRV